ADMRAAYNERILPALIDFAPDILLVSAGFDAHRLDPLGGLNWIDDDYAWLTGRLMDIAERSCGNRIVSMLEGGYDLEGLGRGAGQHDAMRAKRTGLKPPTG